jgi:hypothetical protein
LDLRRLCLCQRILIKVLSRKMVGEWEMGCFAQAGVHYTAGMVGKLVVAPY